MQLNGTKLMSNIDAFNMARRHIGRNEECALLISAQGEEEEYLLMKIKVVQFAAHHLVIVLDDEEKTRRVN